MKTVKWGEYTLGDLFEIEKTLSFNADKLVSGTEFDYVTRTSFNQGILQTTGFVNKENINPAGTWSLGLLQMDFFYRKRPWYAGQFVRKITPKIEIKKSSILFFSTLLNKQKPRLLSVLVRDVDEVFLSTKIYLPIIDDKIDFDFIESFITELEIQQIAELEVRQAAEIKAYLTVSGFDNYELSDEEFKAVQEYQSLDWKSYNLKELFGKSTRGKRLKSADRVIGSLPFVTAGETSEGISAYIGNDVEVFNKNTTTIDMFGSAKYRNYKYGADDHIAVVHTDNLPAKASIFVTSAIHKASYTSKFDYGHNFYAKDADALDIMLPEKNGNPDYAYMETLISAVQKMIVKDVFKKSDAKINATKEVVTISRLDN